MGGGGVAGRGGNGKSTGLCCAVLYRRFSRIHGLRTLRILWTAVLLHEHHSSRATRPIVVNLLLERQIAMIGGPHSLGVTAVETRVYNCIIPLDGR
jgi:hypothetical protein